jgi:hypothetical protein
VCFGSEGSGALQRPNKRGPEPSFEFDDDEENEDPVALQPKAKKQSSRTTVATLAELASGGAHSAPRMSHILHQLGGSMSPVLREAASVSPSSEDARIPDLPIPRNPVQAPADAVAEAAAPLAVNAAPTLDGFDAVQTNAIHLVVDRGESLYFAGKPGVDHFWKKLCCLCRLTATHSC